MGPAYFPSCTSHAFTHFPNPSQGKLLEPVTSPELLSLHATLSGMSFPNNFVEDTPTHPS